MIDGVATRAALSDAPGHPHLAARNAFTTLDGIVQRMAPRIAGADRAP